MSVPSSVLPFVCALAAELVADLQSVSSASARLRPLHAAVSSQFVEVFGADSAGELTASLGPSAASSSAAAAAAAANSSVTQQINLATLRAAQQQDFTTNVGAAGAANSSSATGSSNSAAASGMNIAEDAGDLI